MLSRQQKRMFPSQQQDTLEWPYPTPMVAAGPGQYRRALRAARAQHEVMGDGSCYIITRRGFAVARVWAIDSPPPATESTTMTTSTWARIDTPATRRAMAHLDAWLDEPGYAAIGTWQRSDGRIAVVYTDPACNGVFAVRLEDAAQAAGDYSEWCNTTTDLADVELAALVRDEPTLGRGHRLRYSGACTLVLPDE